MSKNIVICLDGTWNKPDERPHEENEETNVRNLWELLEKDEPDKQRVYYDTGVGSHGTTAFVVGFQDGVYLKTFVRLILRYVSIMKREIR